MADETITQKKCGRCAAVKPLAGFYANRCKPDGYQAICKTCQNASTARWNAENRERKNAKQAAWNRSNRGKVSGYKRKYEAANKEKVDESRRARARRYRERTREKQRAYGREYAKHHPDAWRALDARRRAAVASATPLWADCKKIRAVYREAVRLERETGVARHVDHIVPLRGRDVCGLHVHYNLQILTAAENLKKNNRFEGEV